MVRVEYKTTEDLEENVRNDFPDHAINYTQVLTFRKEDYLIYIKAFLTWKRNECRGAYQEDMIRIPQSTYYHSEGRVILLTQSDNKKGRLSDIISEGLLFFVNKIAISTLDSFTEDDATGNGFENSKELGECMKKFYPEATGKTMFTLFYQDIEKTRKLNTKRVQTLTASNYL